jgi:hypothetical protein
MDCKLHLQAPDFEYADTQADSLDAAPATRSISLTDHRVGDCVSPAGNHDDAARGFKLKLDNSIDGEPAAPALRRSLADDAPSPAPSTTKSISPTRTPTETREFCAAWNFLRTLANLVVLSF